MVATQKSRSPNNVKTDRDKPSEQASERILRAAVHEFGAKGYSGARTAAIAARAGVNPQLITYYFGGKQGLLEELRRRWVSTQAPLVPPDATFAESIAAHWDATLEQPDWARLLLWQALGDNPGDRAGLAQAERPRLREAVGRVKRRQRDGELTTDVDAGFVLLLTYALAFAPITMPQIVNLLLGVDPASAEYRRRCLTQLLTLIDPGRQRSRKRNRT